MNLSIHSLSTHSFIDQPIHPCIHSQIHLLSNPSSHPLSNSSKHALLPSPSLPPVASSLPRQCISRSESGVWSSAELLTSLADERVILSHFQQAQYSLSSYPSLSLSLSAIFSFELFSTAPRMWKCSHHISLILPSPANEVTT